MTKEELKKYNIKCPDRAVYEKVKQNWDRLSKPLDGLGDFEALVCRLGAISKNEYPGIGRRTLVCFCADNGIVAEGVSQCGKEVTALVASALAKGTSTANIMAKKAYVEVLPVDIGIDCREVITGVRDMKVARGTRNFLSEPAMSGDELMQALSQGISLAGELKSKETDILAAGEMGIGNTTTSCAVLCSLLSIPPVDIVGRGAGLDDDGLMKKRRVIDLALEKYAYLNEMSGFERAFETLRCLGGLDMAGMTGLYIGAAVYGLPVVADGLISLTSALLAERLAPGTAGYVFASHAGREKGVKYVLSELSLKPYINGNMALGEGSGALMLFPLIDIAVQLYTKGTSFENAGIRAYERFNK